MKLYLIKEEKEKFIEIEEDITNELDNPLSPMLNKYLDQGFSIIAYSKVKGGFPTCFSYINKDITKEDSNFFINTLKRVVDENKVNSFVCVNYLKNGDYDAVHRIKKNELEQLVRNFCDEKLGQDTLYIKDVFYKFRNLDLDACLENKRIRVVPNNQNKGVVLIKENSTELISLTKRTHAEVIEEYTKTRQEDLYKKENTIVVIVDRNTLFIETPDKVNDYQKEQLSSINKRAKSAWWKTGVPVYIDVIHEGSLVGDIDELLTILSKNKQKGKTSQ